MKLWIHYLAVHADLLWKLDLDGVSEAEAQAFLSGLHAQAQKWNYLLQPGQIAVHGSSIRGFDSNFIREPLRAGTVRDFLAADPKMLSAVPLRKDIELLEWGSDELAQRTTARLLGADFLRQGKTGDRSQILAADQLAHADYQNLLNAVKAFATIASAA